MNNTELTPKEYFDFLKEKKNTITDLDLQNIYNNCLTLLNKYVVTGQVKGALKLKFHLETIEKEMDIVKSGINTFVYRDDIEYYIDNIADDIVKIIELENYEREIPDEIVEALATVKDKFSNFYVVFTDYTGQVERQVEKERRDKDPILFGTFEDKTSGTIIERFYFIGDWEDEYCDLTLDKMVTEMKNANKNISHSIATPKSFEELKVQLSALEESTRQGTFRFNSENIIDSKPQKESFFKKVKTFLTGKK